MSDMDALIAERERSWLDHPIIMECAILPTRTVKDAVARTMLASRKARASISFWADPLTGKSSCIQAIVKAVLNKYPGAGILSLESVEDTNQAEGRLLTSILTSINFAHRVDRELAGKRDQVKRSLIAMSGPERRIFIIIDEAQEITDDEYGWLKAVINGLCTSGIKVCTILFGQRELVTRKAELKANGRSDLYERFLKGLMEFRGVRAQADMDAICDALDCHSEYPAGSGWTYTRFLFPRAYDSGFRFKSLSAMVWEKIKEHVPSTMLKKGLPMDVVAALIANLCLECRHVDAPSFVPTEPMINKALRAALRD
ncbi:hypothetical protein P5Y53_13725 [Dyella jiangningensis]|uniref:AAA family ATPase n=1 Tax=Dyella jiangningensis TaxID=1379159 RepID=UPI00240EAF45|nr:AAA family ATPase [Dyella jiangningensis]MDG2538729.1 hypothetical protein [Dyella jiangningensis]